MKIGVIQIIQRSIYDSLREKVMTLLRYSNKWQGGLYLPNGNGKRLIINQVSSKDKFISGCSKHFEGKKNS